MKTRAVVSLIIMLLVAACTAQGQGKYDLYGAAAINLPGAYASIDGKVRHHIALGLAGGIIDDQSRYLNIKSSLYLDMKASFQFGKSLLFIPVDAGVGFYSGKMEPGHSDSRSGLAVSTGIGYAFLFYKRRIGPFIAFTLDGFTSHNRQNNPLLKPSENNYSVFDATGVLKVGFRF